MKKNISRREWINKSATVIGGSFLGSMIGFSPLKGAPLLKEPVRMMYNENPYGPSDIAKRAMRRAFSESNLYTMRAALSEFKNLIAELNNVKPENVAIGFGSREILNKAAIMNGIDGGELISPTLTFEAINQFASKTMKTNVVRVPMTKEIGIDLKTTGQMVNSKTNMVYLCNPNNPTGVIMNPKELEVFCKETSKKSIVFVDEAYHEYVMDKQYRSMVSLVNEGYDVLISRTASKVHGLAGLRVGYAISTPKIIKRLNSYMNGSLNVVGLRGAIASYKDKRFQKFSIEKNNEGRTIVTDYLDKKGIEYLDSQTNFIFIKTGIDIKKFQPAMEKHKVLVGRPFPPYTDWCRLSIAKPEEMESFNKGFNKELVLNKI